MPTLAATSSRTSRGSFRARLNVSPVVSEVFSVWSSLFLDPEWIPGSREPEAALTYAVDGRSFPTI